MTTEAISSPAAEPAPAVPPDQPAPVAVPPVPETWPGLSPNERRVLGVLVEKAKTTPDAYPLTLNSIVTGSNQKSNRDPVTALIDADVAEALEMLKKLGYVQQIMGSGRTDKYRHVLYDALRVDKFQLAILGELLLRGAQTEGELRTRASRMEPIEDLEALRVQLRNMSQRGLVVYLTPEGRRGTTVTHGLYSTDELQQLKTSAERGGTVAPAVSATPRESHAAGGENARLQNLETSMSELRAMVKNLETAIAALREDFERLAAQVRG
jgi:uncharacterized protein YceH (UPF0502 family)